MGFPKGHDGQFDEMPKMRFQRLKKFIAKSFVKFTIKGPVS